MSTPKIGRAVALARNVPAFVKGWWQSSLRPTSEGLLPGNYPWNYWQCDLGPVAGGNHPAVESCVRAISETVAMLPCQHWRSLPNGGRERVTTSAASRVLRRPNAYQSRTDFWTQVIRHELLQGNGVALGVRNDRYEIASLHVVPHPDACQHFVMREGADASVFYGITNPGLVPMEPEGVNGFAYAVSQRDVLHLRLYTDDDPLHGITPLTSAALSVSAGVANLAHQSAFFTNMGRPSGVLESDVELTPKQMDELRAKWAEQTQGPNSGGTPILGWGMKWKPVTMSAADAAIIESYRMTIADIARVYRVPLAIINELGDATLNNVASLTQFWLSTGLGYMLESIEAALDTLFGLPANEYTEFDTSTLLRVDFRARVEGLTRGIVGGLFSPNEARAEVNLPAVEGGELPRVQQQQVPLDWEPPPTAAPAPAPPPATPEDNAEAAKTLAAIRRRVDSVEGVVFDLTHQQASKPHLRRAGTVNPSRSL